MTKATNHLFDIEHGSEHTWFVAATGHAAVYYFEGVYGKMALLDEPTITVRIVAPDQQITVGDSSAGTSETKSAAEWANGEPGMLASTID